MFSTIIRKSMTLHGIYRFCHQSNFKLLKNKFLKLELVFFEKRHINCTSVLSSNKQDAKEKEIESQNDQERNENQQKSNEKFDENDNKKQEETEKDESKHEQKTRFDYKKEKAEPGSSLIHHTFANTHKKEKETFLECLRMYESHGGKKRDRVSFIYAALKYMKEFGVHKDLTVYKKIIDLLPKEKMIPTNQFQTLFMHYPKEQYCITTLLDQMEDNEVIPDPEMEAMLLNIFGRHGLPLQKYWKMMYWMPKFKNLNPWPVPRPIPHDPYELAKLAMQKISSIDLESKITIFDTADIEDSIEKTWIVSAMAPLQSELLLKHDKNSAIYVEGPFIVYVADKSVDYFILRANPIVDRKFPDYDQDDVSNLRNPYLDTKTKDVILPPCVHEQEDATIFAICATGTSTKDSLLSWVRFLQKSNPVLGEIPIIFTLKNYTEEEKVLIEEGSDKKITDNKSNKDKFLK